jgi:hypothetical protein
MFAPQDFKPLLDFIIILSISYLITLFGIVFLAMGVYITSVKIEKDEVYSLSSEIEEDTDLVGVPEWVRVKGRLVKKFVLNDVEEDEYGGDNFDEMVDEEELYSVKINLLAKFDACHSLFKNKMWYRKNGRLMRRDVLY